MRWPFVSRLAYDAVVHERDRLLAQVQRDAECIRDLMDQVVRMKRAEVGLREVPRAVAKPEAQKPEQIPADVMEIIEGFQSKQVRDGLERDAQAMRSAGNPWPKVREALVRQMGVLA